MAIGSTLVGWTPPASSGSSPIASYDVMSQDYRGVELSRTSVQGTQTSAVVTGLLSDLQTFIFVASGVVDVSGFYTAPVQPLTWRSRTEARSTGDEGVRDPSSSIIARC